MSVGLFVLLTLACAAFLASVACLLSRREPWDLEETPDRFRALERSYARALRTIMDLQYDHQLGTLSDAEHAALRLEYKGKAMALRQALEMARHSAVRRIVRGESAAVSPAERERLEAMVLRARQSEKERAGR